MDEKLIFADGTEMKNAHLLTVGTRELFLYIQTAGMTFKKAYSRLIHPEKTARITAVTMDGQEEIYEGFTELTGLKKEQDGQITAILRKEE